MTNWIKIKGRNNNSKVYGIVTAFFIFLLAHFILGKDEDGNLIVFGIPAIVGGYVVFYYLRLINRSPHRIKKK